MPDTITDDERAAIDAAIADGAVKKIPRGRSSYAMRYDEKTQRVLMHRVAEDGRVLDAMGREGWLAHMKAAGRPPRKQKRSPASAETRETREEALARGRATQQQLADAARAKRVEKIKDALAQGITTRAALAQHVGCNVKTVGRDMRWAGLIPPRDHKAGTAAALEAARAATQRRAEAGAVRIREAIADGADSLAAITRATGYCRETLRRYAAAAGIELPRGGHR